MLENNSYNIDKEFDYDTIKTIILNSLQKILKEETLMLQDHIFRKFGGNILDLTLENSILQR